MNQRHLAGLLLALCLSACSSSDHRPARNPGDATHPQCHPSTGATPVMICHNSAEDMAACPF